MRGIKEDLTRGAWDNISFCFAPLLVLRSALKLGFFSGLARAPKTAGKLALSLDCSPRGVRMLLDCVAAMGFLRKEGTRYGLNRLSRNYFLQSSDDYVGRVVMICEPALRLWLGLPKVVRSGKPAVTSLTKGERNRLEAEIADALFQVHRRQAWKLAGLLGSGKFSLSKGRRSLRILDIASGSAVWSIPLALKHRGAEVVAVDLLPVLKVARKYTHRFRVETRYRFLGADISEVEFGDREYDLALLGHICHSQGEEGSRELIGKCFRALREKGILLIMDFIPDEGRKSALLPLFLAVHALLASPDGDTFTFSEYKKWLLDAGFASVRALRVAGHSPILLALRS